MAVVGTSTSAVARPDSGHVPECGFRSIGSELPFGLLELILVARDTTYRHLYYFDLCPIVSVMITRSLFIGPVPFHAVAYPFLIAFGSLSILAVPRAVFCNRRGGVGNSHQSDMEDTAPPILSPIGQRLGQRRALDRLGS
jgi:hypothetical protein